MAVQVNQREEFAVLTLNQPEALNAFNAETIGESSRAVDEAGRMDVCALIITGAGEKAFCGGADVKEMVGIDLIAKKRKSERGQSTFAKFDALRIPSVALINGYAFGVGAGVGFNLLSCNTQRCDGAPRDQTRTDAGCCGTQRLPRVVREARALEMVMTGCTVHAEEAVSMGLVHRIVSAENRLTDAPGLKAEAEPSTLAFQSKDAQEGVTAFIEKRSAKLG